MNETEHLLTILAEESAEVGQVACKAIRFGLGDVKPGQTENNRRTLERELADLMATAEILGLCIREEDKVVKRERLKKFMEYAREVGTLEGPQLNPNGDYIMHQMSCPTLTGSARCLCQPIKVTEKQVERGPKCGSCDKPIVGHPYCYDCYRET